MLTVITPNPTECLTTVERAKAELGLTGSANDARLLELIAQASEAISDHCKRVFGVAVLQESFRLDRPIEDLILSRYPITEISGITEDGTSLSPSQYEANPQSSIVIRLESDRQCFWCGKVTVSYSAGFTLVTNLPWPIERACIETVKVLWFGGGRDPLLKSESVDGLGSQDYWVRDGAASALPSEVVALLGPHRDLRVR